MTRRVVVFQTNPEPIWIEGFSKVLFWAALGLVYINIINQLFIWGLK